MNFRFAIYILYGFKLFYLLEFDILASSWPGGREQISDKLNLSDTNILELKRLNADQIVEIIKFSGIVGPNSIIREIQEQADGRPGLAITLTDIYKQGGGKDVWQGDVLRRTLLTSSPSLSGQRAHVIIAAFSLGGEAGMPHKSVARELNVQLLDLQQEISYFTAAGIIWEVDRHHLSVKPPALRYAVIRSVFFGSTEWWDVRKLLRHAPNREEAVITLIHSQARNREVNIPDELLIEQLEEVNSIAGWMSYAFLGPDQKNWVLDNRPEKIIHPSRTSLRLVPERVIPLMLNAAVGDKRPLGPNPSHPIRIIQDWIHAAQPNTNRVIKRHQLLLQETQLWMKENGDPDVCLRALQLIMSPRFEAVEPDPGLGNSYIISYGLVTIEELQAIQGLWKAVYDILSKIRIGSNWEPIHDMIHEWVYPEIVMRGDEPPGKVIQLMHSFAEEMLQDILILVKERSGILRWATKIVDELDANIEVPVDKDFMLLYPIINPSSDWERIIKQSQGAIIEMADIWATQSPMEMAKKLQKIENEARIAGSMEFRLTPFLCITLADKVKDIASWAQAFRKVNLPHDLAHPFQQKWLENATQSDENS